MPLPRPARRGVTIVEFALTAPLLFMLVFAGIEFSRANMLLHTTAIAATEGARKGIIAGATAEDCRQAAFDELLPLGIRDALVYVLPETITDETEMITVGVRVPVNTANSYFTPRFFLDDSVIRVVSITREAQSGAEAAAQADEFNQLVATALNNGQGKKLGAGAGSNNAGGIGVGVGAGGVGVGIGVGKGNGIGVDAGVSGS